MRASAMATAATASETLASENAAKSTADDAEAFEDESQSEAAELRAEAETAEAEANEGRAAADEEAAGVLEGEATADEAIASSEEALAAADEAAAALEEERVATDVAAEADDAEAAAVITWIPGLDVAGDAVAIGIAAALAADATAEAAMSVAAVAAANEEAAAAAEATAAAVADGEAVAGDQADAAAAETAAAQLGGEATADETAATTEEATATGLEAESASEKDLALSEQADAAAKGESAMALAGDALASVTAAYGFYVLAGAFAVGQVCIIVPRRALKHGPAAVDSVVRHAGKVRDFAAGPAATCGSRLRVATAALSLSFAESLFKASLWTTAVLFVTRATLHHSARLDLAATRILSACMLAALGVVVAIVASELPYALRLQGPGVSGTAHGAAYWAGFWSVRFLGHLLLATGVLLAVATGGIWHRGLLRAAGVGSLSAPFTMRTSAIVWGVACSAFGAAYFAAYRMASRRVAAKPASNEIENEDEAAHYHPLPSGDIKEDSKKAGSNEGVGVKLSQTLRRVLCLPCGFLRLVAERLLAPAVLLLELYAALYAVHVLSSMSGALSTILTICPACSPFGSGGTADAPGWASNVSRSATAANTTLDLPLASRNVSDELRNFTLSHQSTSSPAEASAEPAFAPNLTHPVTPLRDSLNATSLDESTVNTSWMHDGDGLAGLRSGNLSRNVSALVHSDNVSWALNGLRPSPPTSPPPLPPPPLPPPSPPTFPPPLAPLSVYGECVSCGEGAVPSQDPESYCTLSFSHTGPLPGACARPMSILTGAWQSCGGFLHIGGGCEYECHFSCLPPAPPASPPPASPPHPPPPPPPEAPPSPLPPPNEPSLYTLPRAANPLPSFLGSLMLLLPAACALFCLLLPRRSGPSSKDDAAETSGYVPPGHSMPLTYLEAARAGLLRPAQPSGSPPEAATRVVTAAPLAALHLLIAVARGLAEGLDAGAKWHSDERAGFELGPLS